MRISVVIPHYGRLELLQACLAALWANTELPIEVIVVDNGTEHDINADIVIRNATNRGFAVGCNQGAAAASGEMLIFLNNDTEVRSLWLEPLVAHIEAGAGIVGSKLIYPDGRIQHSGIRIYRDGEGILIAENRHQDHAFGVADAVTGACLAIRRDLFFKVGGFDDGYWNGYDDVDLCLAVRAVGRTVIYEPASIVVHHESASGDERWAAVRANIDRLQQKWTQHPR